MMITKNKVASLTYTLTTNSYEGQIVETIGKDQAVEFLFGVGRLLPAFELALEGKQDGDNFRFQIPAQDAYGVYNPDAVIELSKDIFKRDGVVNNEILFIGNEIPMMDRYGKRMNGVVKEVKDDLVVMDFNHPMAGKDLYFKGIVAQVRDASYEELNPQAHSCGCGSGGSGHEHGGCGCGTSEHESSSCGCGSDHGHDHGGGGGCGCGA